MAVASVTSEWRHDGVTVTDKLLGRIAHQMAAQHLKQYAILVLRMSSFQVGNIIKDAGEDSWLQNFKVLRAWWNSHTYTAEDLLRVLLEGEKLGIVEKGTTRAVLENRPDENGLDLMTSPDFSNMAATFYQDATFQNEYDVLLGQHYNLCDNYIDVGIEQVDQRGSRISKIPLKDRFQIFDGLPQHWGRILVEGGPCEGKTTLTKKLALDWVSGDLKQFDAVFRASLKKPTVKESLEGVILEQMSFPKWVTEKMLHEYLESTDLRVLVVLTGLSETNLTHHPQIQNIIKGKNLINFTLMLVTTHEGATRKLRQKMMRVFKVKSPTKDQVENFISRRFSPMNTAKLLELFDGKFYRQPKIVRVMLHYFTAVGKIPKSLSAALDFCIRGPNRVLRHNCSGPKVNAKVKVAEDDTCDTDSKMSATKSPGIVKKEMNQTNGFQNDGALVAKETEDQLGKQDKMIREYTTIDHVTEHVRGHVTEHVAEHMAGHVARNVNNRKRDVLDEILREFEESLINLSSPELNEMGIELEGQSKGQNQKNEDIENKCKPLDGVIFTSISENYEHILYQMETRKTFFSFLLYNIEEKRDRDFMLLKIAELLVKYSFDPVTGAVVPFNELTSYMEDLIREANSKEGTDPILASEAMFNRVLIDYSSTTDTFSGDQVPNTYAAMRISGNSDNSMKVLQEASRRLKKARVCTVELEEIRCYGDGDDARVTYENFVQNVRHSRHLVSIKAHNVDTRLVAILAGNLPTSVKRLSVTAADTMNELNNGSDNRSDNGSDNLSALWRKTGKSFPPKVNLLVLHLENSTSGLEDMFRETMFPCLREIALKDVVRTKESCKKKSQNAEALLDAIIDGKFPAIEDLSIRNRSLKGCGQKIVKAIRRKSVTTVELVGASLSNEDGDVILDSLAQGALDHIEFMSLLSNPGLNSKVRSIRKVCEERGVFVQIAKAKSKDSKANGVRETIGSNVNRPF